MNALQVVGDAHQIPLAFDLLQSPQQELPKFYDMLDNPKHWLNGRFPFRVKPLAVIAVQPLVQSGDGVGSGRRDGGSLKALVQGGIMRLPGAGDIGDDPLGLGTA